MKRLTTLAAAAMDKVRGIRLRQEGKVPSGAVATMDKVRAWDPRRREEMRERIQNEISVRENLVEEFDPKGRRPCAKDLASEEALWDLYERWSRYHKPGRDYEEKLRRFEIFKQNAKRIYAANHRGKTYRLGLLKYADMSEAERSRALGLGLRRPDKAWK